MQLLVIARLSDEQIYRGRQALLQAFSKLTPDGLVFSSGQCFADSLPERRLFVERLRLSSGIGSEFAVFDRNICEIDEARGWIAGANAELESCRLRGIAQTLAQDHQDEHLVELVRQLESRVRTELELLMMGI